MTSTPADGELPVLVLMGVSGGGKSTVAGVLAERLGWDLREGDDLGERLPLLLRVERKIEEAANDEQRGGDLNQQEEVFL